MHFKIKQYLKKNSMLRLRISPSLFFLCSTLSQPSSRIFVFGSSASTYRLRPLCFGSALLCPSPKMVGGYSVSLVVLSLCLRRSKSFAPSRFSGTTTTSISKTSRGFFNFNKEAEADAAEEEDQDTAYVDEDDPIEKIFGVFFGKKEAKPMGMERFGQEVGPTCLNKIKTGALVDLPLTSLHSDSQNSTQLSWTSGPTQVGAKFHSAY